MTKSISIIATNTKERRQPALEKMPGHWVLARMGKRVLRPGGLELTRRLLAEPAFRGCDGRLIGGRRLGHSLLSSNASSRIWA